MAKESTGARRILFWAIVAQIVSTVLFIGILVLGERSRATLVALYLPRLPLFLGAVLGAVATRWARRHTRIILGAELVLSLLVLFPVMGFHFGSSRAGDHAMRVVSYNVFWGKLGRPKLVGEIAEMDPDIFVGQAAYSSLHDHLKERFPDRHFAQEGEFVMMSRWAISKVDVPPPLADGTSSMFVKFVVETPSGPLRVYDVHPFSPRHALFADDETIANIRHRGEQIAAAVAAAKSDVPPYVLIGDTNLPPMSSMGDHAFTGLKDAFEEVGFGFGYSFPASKPWMRIDRALGSDRVRFLDVHAGPRGFSDHRPLLVSLDLADDR